MAMMMMDDLTKRVVDELVNLAKENLYKDPPDIKAAVRLLKAAILQKQAWESENE
jgi:hypothetical protein